MKITLKWLKEKNACSEGVKWFSEQKEKCGVDGIKVLKALIVAEKLDWTNWLIVRIMKYSEYVGYAVYAAEQVIDLYEKKYPDDKRPRNAIKAAKKCIEDPSEENKSAAYAAALIAVSVAHAAANAAYAAAYAAADVAASAANIAGIELKILNYGLSLLEVKE